MNHTFRPEFLTGNKQLNLLVLKNSIDAILAHCCDDSDAAKQILESSIDKRKKKVKHFQQHQ